MVFCHAENDYHHDHQAAFHLSFSATFIAALKNIKSGAPSVDKTPLLYQMDTLSGIRFEPEEYVDISSGLQDKLKMLSIHRSQVEWLKHHDGMDISEMVTVQARFRGLQSGVKYAESFRLVRGWGRVPVKRFLP